MKWPWHMSPQALTTYAAKHEDESVREYINALIEERAELRSEIAATSRIGYTEKARATVRRGVTAFIMFLLTAAAYFTGQAGH